MRKIRQRTNRHRARAVPISPDLLMRLDAMEQLAKRNRTDLEIQLIRIAELQEEIDALKQVGSARGAATTAAKSISRHRRTGDF